MKFKHWVLVVVMVSLGIASTGGSYWLRRNGQAFYMPSSSMQPTLPLGARILGNMHAYDSAPPRRNDIALLELSSPLLLSGSGTAPTTLVKRVVGVPSDRVEMKRGVLSVNGVVQKEPFVRWKGPLTPGPPYFYDMKVIGGKVYSRDVGGPWMLKMNVASDQEQSRLSSASSQPIPPDKYLVLGDNRGNSIDSHVFGLVPRSYFRGRVEWQYWPHVHSF